MNLLLKSFGLAILFWAVVAGFITAVMVLSWGLLWLVNSCPGHWQIAIVSVVVLAFTTYIVYEHKKIQGE